jgi:hypothetical protein
MTRVRHRRELGSLDQQLLTRMMDENSHSAEPKDGRNKRLLHSVLVPTFATPALKARILRPLNAAPISS